MVRPTADPASVLVVRPGRGDTGLLVAAERAGRLDVRAAHDVDLPSLTPSGTPNKATSAVIAGLIGELGAAPDSAWLALPPGSTPLRRVEVELPIDRAVEHGQVVDALQRARVALSDGGRTAVLSCRPTRYAVDGTWGEGDPTGRKGRRLTVEATALCAALGLLARFERALAEAGLALSGVVAPAEALVAACLPDREGRAVHVGHGATLAVAARGGAITHQAHVPLGRRHLEQDAAEVSALERDAARAAVAAVVAGEAHLAAAAVQARLAELRELLDAAQEAAGFGALPRTPCVTSGLPPAALADDGDDQSVLPCAAHGDPLLEGTALLALGLRGEADQPALVRSADRVGVLGWLRARF